MIRVRLQRVRAGSWGVHTNNLIIVSKLAFGVCVFVSNDSPLKWNVLAFFFFLLSAMGWAYYVLDECEETTCTSKTRTLTKLTL